MEEEHFTKSGKFGKAAVVRSSSACMPCRACSLAAHRSKLVGRKSRLHPILVEAVRWSYRERSFAVDEFWNPKEREMTTGRLTRR